MPLDLLGKPRLRSYGLVIVDMLNDYLTPEGQVYCSECRDIIPHIARVSKFLRSRGGTVYYVNTELTKSDILAKKWGLHAVRGSRGAQVVDELAPIAGDSVIKKKYYDGFYKTALEGKLRANGVKNVLITGIHTHVCVLLTAVGAFQRGFDVTALDDCFTTGHKANHESRLRFFHSHLGTLSTSVQWMQSVDS